MVLTLYLETREVYPNEYKETEKRLVLSGTEETNPYNITQKMKNMIIKAILGRERIRQFSPYIKYSYSLCSKDMIEYELFMNGSMSIVGNS